MSSAQQILQNAADSFKAIVSVAEEVNAAADIITDCLKQGGKIFFCGNGGSAGDAQHLEAEFLGRFLKEREALPAIALTTNASAVTAIANDYGYEEVFSRQLTGLAKAGDVLVGISTSGNSPNVIKAFHVAKEYQVKTIAMTGQNASEASALADITIRAPSTETPRIQEMHIAIGHTLCEIAENHLT
jgi:D-sedoheptulose 7-phosphate isomerase